MTKPIHTLMMTFGKVAFFSLSALFFSFTTFAQTAENRMLILGDATEEVVANQATLSIGLVFSNEREMQPAYGEHEQARQKLTALLAELKVPTQDIRFLPLMSRKGRDFQRGQPGDRFTTYQRVLVKFNDLDQHFRVQQALTTNGFTDLTSTFAVSNQKEIENRLMDRALARAREKANQLAKATSRTVGRVVRVSDVSENESISYFRDPSRYGNNPNPGYYDEDSFRRMAATQQIFRLGAALKVEFELE